MGYSSYNDDFYRDRVTTRAATSTPTFKHDADVKSGKVSTALNPLLDINGKIRESRDSAEHPNSTAIAVFCDVTGSMARVPGIVQGAIPQLMGLLLRKAYIEDPQVLFGAIGDYFADKVALQVGQFESGVEMDDSITAVYLEGGGGGTYEESYQNALFYLGNRTSCDCYEKRGKKGYAFIIGDEKPYPQSTRAELQALMGVSVQADVPLAEIMKSVLEKWEVFFIIPKGTNHYSDPALERCWADLLGSQRVIKVEDPAAICETIGGIIGLCEGSTTHDSLSADLKDVGASGAVVSATTTSLRDLTALARVGSGDLPERTGRSTATARL